ncbi:DUF86 domain-containing protein [Methanotrichaceae archaeon M04Ac]|uniref:DUF86 domain-containing protein n=1 Tax=Candidatus Methanocrinis alkalitolerans TaxID=3033395 RepID=A0ABT5XG81_9EURY|nr:DUF86 domain-containing protein [Candidatus Methanocrinis alkalitolerans]MDF0593723.1 DUF86 domain-containing protein [Candidatus Methanocrinis alkalitolerans]
MRKGTRVYTDHLRDILYAAERAEGFIEGMDFSAFEADEKTCFAVVRALEIVGEATKKIPPEVRQIYPELPWREMVGMRDKLSHDYFGVDLWRVFETVRRDIPPLRASLEDMIRDLDKDKCS